MSAMRVLHATTTFLILLTLAFQAPVIFAQVGRKKLSASRAAKAREESKKKPTADETFPEKVLTSTNVVGDAIGKAADKVDVWVAGRRYIRKPNESSATLTQRVTWREQGKINTSTDFGFNVRLPNIERRWQLRFTSYDEEEAQRNLEERRRVRTTPRKREYGAGLFFFQKLGNIKTTFQPRLVLKDPLEMSYLLRAESAAEMKRTRLSPKLELFAHPEKGTGEFFSLEFVTPISEKMDFILTNDEEYREKDNFFLTNHGVSADYALTEDKALGLSFLFACNNKDTYHLDGFKIATTFAHEIRMDKLKYYVSPFLDFQKIRNFKGETGVTLNIELIF